MKRRKLKINFFSLPRNSWLDQYKKRVNWHRIKIQRDSGSTDKEATKNTVRIRKNIIEEESFMI